MTEAVLALRWLNSVLVPDVVLSAGLPGGWHLIPPVGARTPVGVVRQVTSGADLTGIENAELIWSPLLFQVNLYDRYHDYSRIDPLASRVYALLNGKGGINFPTIASGGVIYSCRRATAPRVTIETDGQTETRLIEQQFAIDAKAT